MLARICLDLITMFEMIVLRFILTFILGTDQQAIKVL